MALFEYIALDTNGKKIKGSIDALSRKQALVRLKQEFKLNPLALNEESGKDQKVHAKEMIKEIAAAPSTSFLKRKASINGEKVALGFLRKLLQLNSSGLPIGDAIKTLSRRVTDPALKELSTLLWRDLSEGLALALAMSRYPKTFDTSIVHLIEAGEATGNITPILRNIIELLETRAELRKKLAASLVYPIFISCVALGVVGLFLLFLLPRIQTMLLSLGGELSLSAKILIGFGDFLLTKGPFVLVLLTVMIVGFFQWRKTTAGLKTSDRILIKAPLIGPILINADLSRISNLMATLLESGVTMNETLKLAEKSIKNTTLQQRFIASRTMINDGAAFSVATSRNQLFPSMDIDILSVGENTGNLVKSFKEIYKTHAEELTTQLKMVTTTISSAAMLFAFSLVTILTLGIVTSIMQLSQSLLH